MLISLRDVQLGLYEVHRRVVDGEEPIPAAAGQPQGILTRMLVCHSQAGSIIGKCVGLLPSLLKRFNSTLSPPTPVCVRPRHLASLEAWIYGRPQNRGSHWHHGPANTMPLFDTHAE